MATLQPRFMPLPRVIPLTLAVCAVWAHPGAQGASQDIEHKIQRGDTLEALSAHYLGSPTLWPRLQAHNHVADVRRLQPGATLRIPMQLLPRGMAQASFVQGQVNVTAPEGGPTSSVKAGQSLPEGARLQVGSADSFVTVRLADGTLIRVRADTDLRLQLLRRRGRAGSAQSVLELQRGSVETSVPPNGAGERRLEIHTPKASTSVRGTRFAVILPGDERTLTAVTEGRVMVTSPKSAAATMVDAGQGLAVAADGQPSTPRTLLPAPDLSGLPDTVHDADFLTLALTPVTAAVAYQVQLARDADLTEVVRDETFTGPSVRLRAVEDGSYHLAVRAIDSGDLPGRVATRVIAVKAHPIAPLYQTPTRGSTVSRAQGKLLCTQVSGSARYRIQVAGDASFAAPVLDEVHAPDCSAQVAALPPGSYYWRAASIRALPDGRDDQGPYGPGEPFTVADNPAALNVATLQESADGSGLHLRWTGEPGQGYRLQLADSEDFSNLIIDERLTSPEWSNSGLAPGHYYVRIQVRNPSGLESEFSTPRRVRTFAAVRTGAGDPVTSSDGRPLSRP